MKHKQEFVYDIYIYMCVCIYIYTNGYRLNINGIGIEKQLGISWDYTIIYGCI